MNTMAQDHIPLQRAYLCLDCDVVCASATTCPACASGALLGLASVLGMSAAVEDLGVAQPKPLKRWPKITRK
jgi:hypothetical protein